MSKDSGSEATTRNEGTPERMAAIKKFLDQATTQADIPLQFFPGSTVGGRDALSRDAEQQVGGLGESGYRGAAESHLEDVISGEFMGPQGENPLLDARFDVMAKRISEQQKRIVQPGLQTRFGGSGRSMSDASNKAFQQNDRDVTRELGDLGTNIYYEDYNRRMQERMQGLSLTKDIQGLEYQDIGQKRQQGAIEEDYDQRLLNEDINRFNFNQTEPEERLDRFGNRVQKNLGFGSGVNSTQAGDGGAGTASILSSLVGLFLAA